MDSLLAPGNHGVVDLAVCGLQRVSRGGDLGQPKAPP
jgi:hypothetical protein